jgi:Flp pilus assembly pilin Flp
VPVQGWLLIKASFAQAGQGMVEFALILALVALIVIVALLATGGQVINLYSDIVKTMCLYHAGC